MHSKPTSIGEQARLIAQRCSQMGLTLDCGPADGFTTQLAVIGEAPGEAEAKMKRPLVGGSGRLLWDKLRPLGYNRGHFYVTNVVKRRLLSVQVHGREKLAIAPNELEHWFGLLKFELEQLPNLRYILAMGNYALQALVGHNKITQHRGSHYDIMIGDRPVRVLTTFNPAHVMREARMEVVLQMDLKKFHRMATTGLNLPEINHIIEPTFHEVIDYLAYIESRDLPIAYDIETINGQTACIGLAQTDTEGMCINFVTGNGREPKFGVSDEMSVRLALQRVLGNPKTKLIAQNNGFDATWLWYKDRIRSTGAWMDTMLAHHLLYPRLPHGLGFLTSQYTDYPFHKEDAHDWRGREDINALWRYNVKDVCYTRQIAHKLGNELRAQKLWDFFQNHVMALQPHLARMMVCGVKVDMSLKDEIAATMGTQVAVARQRINELAAQALSVKTYEVNPNSPAQMRKLLFSELGLVGRGVSVDEENRNRMRGHPRTSEAAKELLNAIDGHAEVQKLYSTYATATADPDGRIRCEYRQTGTQEAPGRLSSAQTLWGTGMNLQNIPEVMKKMFIADDGYELSYFDAAQIEARFVAFLANIMTWKEQFERARLNPGSYDAHRALAADLYDMVYESVPVSDWDEHGRPTVRYIAKRCRHGLNYRMQAPRLATQAKLPVDVANRAFARYHRLHPEIKAWWDKTINTAKTTMELRTPLGRRWILLERPDENTFDSVIAFVPQSTAGDHIASVIRKCERDPRWPRSARIVLNIHDANIAMNKPEDGRVVRGLMKLYAEEAIWFSGEPCIVPADFAVSHPDEKGIHRWSTLKKLKSSEVAAPSLVA